MRIINLNHPESHAIEPPLVKMASSEDRLEALKGRKLLELVRHLQAQGPAPQVCGSLVLRHELWLMTYNLANQVLVKVWVDWQDYGPLFDGLPVAHYRLQFKGENSAISENARAGRPEEAEQVLLKAFDSSA